VIPHFELGAPVDQSHIYNNPAHAAYGEALAAAVDQRGPVVLVVICDRPHERGRRSGSRTIGTVSRRPAGLFYESMWEEPIPPGERRLRAEKRRTDPGDPLARRGRFVNGSRGLLDHPDLPVEWHAVQARCGDHGGIGIEITDLLTEARAAGPARPARVRVSPNRPG
jgi:hypothetical protein